MKNAVKLILIFLVIANILASILITVFSICTNRYFSEYENLKSLKNIELYMSDDFLFIDSVDKDTGTGEGTSMYFDVYGRLLSDNSKVKLKIGEQEFLGTDKERQPLYKSKITGDIFLKDAPQEYYNDQLKSLYAAIYLKFSFYIILGIIIYYTIRYIKNRRYRL